MGTKLIVLANSWKRKDYCVAGIEPETGNWVRPVSDLHDGRITKAHIQLRGYFPKLLDVIEIPLAKGGPDFGFERENRSILPGDWHLVATATAAHLLRYSESPRTALHNDRKYVTIAELQSKPKSDRKTLQLLHVNDFQTTRTEVEGRRQWCGVFSSAGYQLQLRITDPIYCERLNTGHQAVRSCLLTISLGMSFVPPNWPAHESPPCWKLIAGIIELPPENYWIRLARHARTIISRR